MPIRTGRSAWALLVCIAAVMTGCGSSKPTPPTPPAPRPTPRLFSQSSVWNAQLPDNAPVDSSSRRLVTALYRDVIREFRYGPSPYIQTVTDSTPIYRVAGNQPTVRVTLDNDQPWARTLARALRAVPMPSSAQPAAGSDAHLTIWQPSTDRLWELWKARRTADGWHASWGGAIQDVSRSPGYYTTQSWPGAQRYWGATATSLPMVAGTMTIAELQRRQIDHALAIALPVARAGEYSWPAQRTDGTDTSSSSIPEGAHLRLDPRLNIPSLHLPPVIEDMALAAQRYGLIVRDKTASAVGFFAEAPQHGNPYTAIFRGVPSYVLLKSFPWSHLELLHMDLHSGTGSPA